MTEINFEDYLSEYERKEIVTSMFRQAVTNALRTSNDVERFVGNVAYVAIEDRVDAALEGDARQIIAEKAATIIRNMTEYSVFRDGTGILHPKESLAKVYLNEAVKNNKDMIEKRVKRIINEVGRDDVKWALKEAIDNAFSDEKEN